MKAPITVFSVFSFVSFALFLAACGKSGGSSADDLCQILVDCGADMSMTECLSSVGTMVLTNDCLEAAFAASCEDHNSDTPSYFNTCFSSCGIEGQNCSGDYMYVCSNGVEMVFDCALVCERQYNGGYSGVCSETGPNGEVSENGEVCWCE